MDWIINHPHAAWIALVIPFVVVTALAAWRWRALARRRLAQPHLLRGLVPPAHRRARRIRTTFLLLGLALLVVAACDIRWGKKTVTIPQKGVDLVFALDVSRSMLAQDTAPNRLGRARQFINDLARASTTDRVALLTFAGRSRQALPLSSDHNDLAMALEEAGPQSAPRGGTRLGDALRDAADCFLDKTADYKAIVLITDGEDHGSDAVNVATELLKDNGIRTYTIAIGDTNTGARVPVGRRPDGQLAYLQHEGKDVWSKADTALLEKIALAGGGAYIPAGTKSVDMGAFYRRHLATLNAREYRKGQVERYTPRFQWFLTPALVCLVLSTLITGRHRPARNGGNLFAAAGLLALLLVASGASAASPEQAYNEAVDAYRQGDLNRAGELLAQGQTSRDPQVEARARFNLGNLAYRRALETLKPKTKGAQPDRKAAIALLDTAIARYREALAVNARDNDARVNIELAQRLKKQLQQEQKKQDQKKQQQKKQDQQQQNKNQQNQQQNKQDQQSKQDQQQDQQNKDQQASNKDKKNQQKKDENKDDQAKGDKQDEQKDDQAKGDKKDEQKDDQAKGDKKDEQKDDQAKGDKKDEQKPDEPKPSDEQPRPDKTSEPQTAQGKPGQSGEKGQPGDQVVAADKAKESKEMSAEHAARLLQAVRDRNLKRRIMEVQRQRMQRQPVSRDW